MTKEVLISISGMQMMDDNHENIEIITAGEYFYRNGNHYILYEELMEGFSGITKNLIRIRPDQLEITKKGIANTKMKFMTDEKKTSSYMTPMGELVIGIKTKHIEIDEQQDKMQVIVDYALDINYDHISDCHIVMDVQSKAVADLKLYN